MMASSRSCTTGENRIVSKAISQRLFISLQGRDALRKSSSERTCKIPDSSCHLVAMWHILKLKLMHSRQVAHDGKHSKPTNVQLRDALHRNRDLVRNSGTPFKPHLSSF
ncbi:hypothetical protein CB0940_08438 [Cercospora beticola]|uniref:Uncharacterized protein n=1 Tax=Cercospora beticola TaxID=122368 RepID=A0A2G5HP47_CERBT|nr:hypothetical protein CB0940_08438 [Cercospora beticola]PIA94315.1 hypothetical protein CB0940_08438 [Cercospora beticola]